MNGETVTLADSRDHFHIIAPAPDPFRYAPGEPSDPNTSVPTREGMYSRCHGDRNNFEWDGWRSHD